MPKPSLVSADSAAKLRNLMQGGNVDFDDPQADSVPLQVYGQAVVLVKAVADTTKTITAGSLKIWTGNIVSFNKNAATQVLSTNTVYMVDQGNNFVADHHYFCQSAGDIGTGITGITSGLPMYMTDTRIVPVATCSVPAGTITNAAQTLCGRKQFNDGITCFNANYFLVSGNGLPYICGFMPFAYTGSQGPCLRLYANQSTPGYTSLALDVDPNSGAAVLGSPDGTIAPCFAINIGNDPTTNIKYGATTTLIDGTVIVGGIVVTGGSGGITGGLAPGTY
jgi:hypothetical protein